MIFCEHGQNISCIKAVKVVHPYETGFGKEITVPFYFQKPTTARKSAINKKLGEELTVEQIEAALKKMGNTVTVAANGDDTTPGWQQQGAQPQAIPKYNKR